MHRLPCRPGRRRLRWNNLLALLLGAILFGESAPVSAAPLAQATPATGTSTAPAPSLQDCSAVSEDALQGELNTVTQGVFAAALAAVDLDAIVARHWVTLQMDAAVAEAVDLALARVQSETDLWNQFLSGWSPDKAQELTLAVATYTFDAPTFRLELVR